MKKKKDKKGKWVLVLAIEFKWIVGSMMERIETEKVGLDV